MTTRNGKIAKLPDHIREQLNHRLNDGESGSLLVEWLNTQPEVQSVLDSFFDGRQISEQNLSEWRNGGFLEWTTLHDSLEETRVLAGSVAELAATGISTQSLLLVMTAQYAAVLNTWQLLPEAELSHKLNALRKISAAVLALHRSQVQEARLQLQRERFQFTLDKEARRSAAAAAAPVSKSRAKRASTDASTDHCRAAQPASAPMPPTLEELGLHGTLSEVLHSSGLGDTSESAFSELLASLGSQPAILSTRISTEASAFIPKTTFAHAA